VSFTTIFLFQTNISLQKIYSIAMKSSVSELITYPQLAEKIVFSTHRISEV